MLTLLDITKEIQSAILLKMNRYYWVKAEIAKLNYYRQSGHCYPQLVEKRENLVVAEMRATIWANDYQQIIKKFREATGEEITEGMTILCHARVNYHPVYGLSLQIADIDPAFTMGEMAKERQNTIKKLKEEGLWDQNRNIPMPLLPKRLAVISVESSKGYQDFRSIIDDNSWGYRFFHILFPALLQGDKAVESIGKQLELIRKHRHHFDVVLIIRGGGGDVGLNCFDHYDLASRVAAFPLPVISGIGHSTNETVVEMVSHTNSITPTDLAYGLIQKFHNFSVKLEEMAEAVVNVPAAILDQENRRLSEAGTRLVTGTLLFTRQQSALIRQLATRATFGPMQKTGRMEGILGQLESSIPKGITSLVSAKRIRLDALEQHLRILDPKNVLERGYSIVRKEGRALRTTTEVTLDDELEITLFQGIIHADIKKITP
ncbi:MAG TPA: exodeoxyribonuclease VII large subunit [Bacteroidales bacterium]|nr:exodeoxyribonuclease VII large subunit [Bacteroidales bacterium]HRZ47796.1 exodeoxyribonuclease VII large subunit [Bacteroidales bacterium]